MVGGVALRGGFAAARPGHAAGRPAGPAASAGLPRHVGARFSARDRACAVVVRVDGAGVLGGGLCGGATGVADSACQASSPAAGGRARARFDPVDDGRLDDRRLVRPRQRRPGLAPGSSAGGAEVGDPVGDEAAAGDAVRGFVAHCREQGWTPALYGVVDEVAAIVRETGWSSVQVAEETLLPWPACRSPGGGGRTCARR